MMYARQTMDRATDGRSRGPWRVTTSKIGFMLSTESCQKDEHMSTDLRVAACSCMAIGRLHVGGGCGVEYGEDGCAAAGAVKGRDHLA